MSLAVLKLDLVVRRCLAVRPSPALCASLIKYRQESTGGQAPPTPAPGNNNSNITTNEETSEVQKFVSSLTAEHRQEILVEIQKLESAEMRQRAEGEMFFSIILFIVTICYIF